MRSFYSVVSCKYKPNTNEKNVPGKKIKGARHPHKVKVQKTFDLPQAPPRPTRPDRVPQSTTQAFRPQRSRGLRWRFRHRGGRRATRVKRARRVSSPDLCVRVVGERARGFGRGLVNSPKERERGGKGGKQEEQEERKRKEGRDEGLCTHPDSLQSRTASTSSPAPSPTSHPHSPPHPLSSLPTSSWR